MVAVFLLFGPLYVVSRVLRVFARVLCTLRNPLTELLLEAIIEAVR